MSIELAFAYSTLKAAPIIKTPARGVNLISRNPLETIILATIFLKTRLR